MSWNGHDGIYGGSTLLSDSAFTKAIVITGAQHPIDLEDTDARVNLMDSLRFAANEKAHDVCVVFDGKIIAGTRAKKEHSKSYNAFASVNYPYLGMISDGRVLFVF